MSIATNSPSSTSIGNLQPGGCQRSSYIPRAPGAARIVPRHVENDADRRKCGQIRDDAIGHLADASRGQNALSQNGTNFMLSVVKGIEPRDQIEAMLAAQMAAVHAASMTFARRLAHVENIPRQDSAERAFNKLTRTFAAQMSALKEYRSKGEQKMTVQHVHVAEGGQAIVGNVNAPAEGVGARKKVEEQPHALAYAPGVAVSCDIEAEREAVPRARRSGT
jgi:hypothetical protein